MNKAYVDINISKEKLNEERRVLSTIKEMNITFKL